ncbi:MAG: hypothetical protein K0U41_05770 [Gammaproteobacteria bacterium]|nr:hypothetical protein [Gammaproteobacteria bacterium]
MTTLTKLIAIVFLSCLASVAWSADNNTDRKAKTNKKTGGGLSLYWTPSSDLVSIDHIGRPGGKPEGGSGLGLRGDLYFNSNPKHNIAFDYYSISERTRATSALRGGSDDAFNFLSLGYRYQSRYGFYYGISALFGLTRTLERPQVAGSQLARNPQINEGDLVRLTQTRKPVSTPFAYNLGYQFVSRSGFAIGFHHFGTFAYDDYAEKVCADIGISKDCNLSAANINSIVLQTTGITLGYSWR